MDNSWDNLEPAPIEFLHGEILKLFHDFRRQQSNGVSCNIDGIELNNIIAKAKTVTYNKYKKLQLKKAIPKDQLI